MTVGVGDIPNVSQLHRLVSTPLASLDDAARARLTAIADDLFDWDVSMPEGYGHIELSEAMRPMTDFHEQIGVVGSAEQVLAAWDVRLANAAVDQAHIGARIDELITGAPATLESSRGIAELRTLLHISDRYLDVPRQLGVQDREALDGVLAGIASQSIAYRESIGASGRRFIENWQLTRDPQRLGAWQARIEAAASQATPLGDDASLELLVTPAAGWERRTSAERRNLLDALTTMPDGRVTTALSRSTNREALQIRHRVELERHLDLQVQRAASGQAELPHGLSAWELMDSLTFLKTTPDVRADLVAAFEARGGELPMTDMLRAHGNWFDHRPVAYGIAKSRLDAALVDAVGSGTPLPGWVHIGHVLDAGLSDADEMRLMLPMLRELSVDTPDGARTWMEIARRQLTEFADGAPPEVEDLVESTRRLMDRNLARIGGEPGSGYGFDPDYAEVGRAIANVELLERLAATARPVGVAAADIAW